MSGLIMLAGLFAGTVGGSVFGAWLAGVPLWKGAAIVISAWIVQVFLSLFLLEPQGWRTFSLDFALWIVCAVLIAPLLSVAWRGAGGVIIGGLLGYALVGGAAILIGMDLSHKPRIGEPIRLGERPPDRPR